MITKTLFIATVSLLAVDAVMNAYNTRRLKTS